MLANRSRLLVKRRIESIASMMPSRASSGDSLILAYHNVVPNEEVGYGDASLHLAAEQFATQLRIATEECDVVSLSDLLRLHGQPGRRLAVSFDDAYSGCVDLGIPLCSRVGVVPVIFIAPALLGQFMPWDLRSAAMTWTQMDRAEFLAAGGVAAATMSQESNGLLPESFRIATLDSLTQASLSYQFEVGNHTNRHVNIAATDPDDVVDELSRAESFLSFHFRERLVSGCVAYPYGNVPSPVAASYIRDHYRAGFKVTGGWHRKSQPIFDFFVNRLNIPAGISPQRFRAQLRGWLL